MRRTTLCRIALSALSAAPALSARGDVLAWSREVSVFNLVPLGPDPVGAWSREVSVYNLVPLGPEPLSAWSREVSVWRNTCPGDIDLDGSRNVNDFIAFLNAFAAGSPSANCDASYVPPVLNVIDFVCFLNVFAAGCS